jgi:hypothetical protein
LKLAVVLLVCLSGVLAWATVVEADKGREYAQWYVYDSPWFLALLGILGVNILAATLIRFPWRKRQAGFVVTHAGLLLLLGGSLQTFRTGIEGTVTLRKGGHADKILVPERSVITATQNTADGPVRSDFSFRPGPVDWSDGEVLDFGMSGGLGLRVLRYYRHARERIEWVADTIDSEGPALRLSLLNSGEHTVAQDWLAASIFGGEANIGPTRYQLLPIPHESMLEDFLNPPSEPRGAGVLSIHLGGHMQRVSVDDHLGTTIPVGTTGVAVEIVRYLPNAKPTPNGEFVSRPEGTDNPVLELNIHLPKQEEPRRQLAFAKAPLLNLDGVHGVMSPVKFWYHHPGTKPIAGAEFVQTPAGKLYCRPVKEGARGTCREVAEGDRVAIGGGFRVVIEKYIPHARRRVVFSSIETDLGAASGATSGPEAAVLVEVTTAGSTREVWLKRQDDLYGTTRLTTTRGPLELTFAYEELPLGFRLELEDFTRRQNPGRVGDAAFSSSVRLIDAARAIHRQHEISMNEPLSHGKFRFYQASFQELSGGREVSVLTAACDPGRTLKYLGSCLICGGIVMMFCTRSYMFKSVPRIALRRTAIPGALSPDSQQQVPAQASEAA